MHARQRQKNWSEVTVFIIQSRGLSSKEITVVCCYKNQELLFWGNKCPNCLETFWGNIPDKISHLKFGKVLGTNLQVCEAVVVTCYLNNYYTDISENFYYLRRQDNIKQFWRNLSSDHTWKLKVTAHGLHGMKGWRNAEKTNKKYSLKKV